MQHVSQFPFRRMRRLRRHDFSRRMVAENQLSPADFIYPVFVLPGEQQREKVASMPGVERVSIDLLVAESKELAALRIPGVALLPVTPAEDKSLRAGAAWDDIGLAQRAVRAIKAEV